MGEYLAAIQEYEQADFRALENEAAPDTQPPFLKTESIREAHDGLREAFGKHGPEGYWRKRLERAAAASTPDAHYVATLFARVEEMSVAYDWLAKALEMRTLSGLCFDLCWDRRDRRFREIAQQVGLLG